MPSCCFARLRFARNQFRVVHQQILWCRGAKSYGVAVAGAYRPRGRGASVTQDCRLVQPRLWSRRLRQNADFAIACAKDALRTRRRFYVAFDDRGFDSHGTTGLAANSDGAVYEVDTEQLTDGWGGHVRNDGRVRKPIITLCQKAPFESISFPANRFLSCLTEPTPE